MPTSPARARRLLKGGKAAVFRMHPFTIILKYRETGDVQPVQVKVDPGSKVTGITVVAEFKKRGHTVLFGMNLTHRGAVIKQSLDSRRAIRRSRRNRNTRYRKARFLNRTRPAGWLAPSIESRVHNTLTWLLRLKNIVPVSGISIERVKFDMQKMHNPEIAGTLYQKGTLFGFELREYLLEKFGRKCVYCGTEHIPVEIEHVVPKTRGGTDRVTNLVLSCKDCNRDKGTQSIRAYLKEQPDKLESILKQLKSPLKDVAAINATRTGCLTK